MAFCKNCGAPVEVKSEEQVVKISTYLGYTILMIIPLVNLIIMILTACGCMWNGNKNMSNLARAQLITFGIIFGLYFILIIIAAICSLFF